MARLVEGPWHSSGDKLCREEEAAEELRGGGNQTGFALSSMSHDG
jgi:hypothetical protein